MLFISENGFKMLFKLWLMCIHSLMSHFVEFCFQTNQISTETFAFSQFISKQYDTTKWNIVVFEIMN